MVHDALYYSRKFKRRRIIRRLFLSLAILAAVSGGIIYLFYLPYFRVQNISVSGLTRLTSDEVAHAARELIAGKVALVLPADNILVLPKAAVLDGLRGHFLRIKELDLSRQWPAAINISVSERNTWAIYCHAKCFLSDRGGFLFDDAPDLEGNLFLKIYDERGVSYGLSDSLFNGERFAELADFRDTLERVAGEPVLKIFLKQADRIEFHFAGWYAFIDRNTDFKNASENLALALADIKDKKNHLEYADLRLGSKVFIKYRD